jgi:hypothetical protein
MLVAAAFAHQSQKFSIFDNQRRKLPVSTNRMINLPASRLFPIAMPLTFTARENGICVLTVPKTMLQLMI